VREGRKVYVTSQHEALLCCFLGRFTPKTWRRYGAASFCETDIDVVFRGEIKPCGATLVTRKVFAQPRADPQTAQQPIEDVNILICVSAYSVSRESF
jgi:hypothetical protein